MKYGIKTYLIIIITDLYQNLLFSHCIISAKAGGKICKSSLFNFAG